MAAVLSLELHSKGLRRPQKVAVWGEKKETEMNENKTSHEFLQTWLKVAYFWQLFSPSEGGKKFSDAWFFFLSIFISCQSTASFRSAIISERTSRARPTRWKHNVCYDMDIFSCFPLGWYWGPDLHFCICFISFQMLSLDWRRDIKAARMRGLPLSPSCIFI